MVIIKDHHCPCGTPPGAREAQSLGIRPPLSPDMVLFTAILPVRSSVNNGTKVPCRRPSLRAAKLGGYVCRAQPLLRGAGTRSGCPGYPCTRFIESMTLALAEPFRGAPHTLRCPSPPYGGGVHRILRIPERGLEE